MTGYKTVLTVFRSPQSAATLRTLTSEIANRWQSHVIGLFEGTPLSVNVGLRGPELKKWLSEKRDRIISDCTAVRTEFERGSRTGYESWEWCEGSDETGTGSNKIIELSKCADLTMIERSAKETSFIEPDITLERLVFESGRPLLATPAAYTGDHLARRSVIAWNGTRHASRAIFDALPLISHADVEALRLVCPAALLAESEPGSVGKDLVRTLERHGIEIEIMPLSHRYSGAGRSIIAECDEFKADSLIMGAYGHSRLREYVFGGATQTILNECPVPVFLAH